MLRVLWVGMHMVACTFVWPPTYHNFRGAAKEGNLEYVKWFFQNAGDDLAAKAAFYAARRGHGDVLEWLSNVDEVVSTLPSRAVVTAAIRTAAAGHPEGMETLLQLDPDEFNAAVEDEDEDGRTLLHWFAKFGRPDEVRVLLDHNAAVDAEDDDGDTALHRAAKRGREGVVRVLLEFKAAVDAKNDKGVTPLSLAASDGPRYSGATGDVVQTLLDHGADGQAKDESGQTALQTAGSRMLFGVVKALGGMDVLKAVKRKCIFEVQRDFSDTFGNYFPGWLDFRERAFDFAVKSRDLEATRVIRKHLDLPTRAYNHMNLDSLKWLAQQGIDFIPLKRKSREMKEWLAEQGIITPKLRRQRSIRYLGLKTAQRLVEEGNVFNPTYEDFRIAAARMQRSPGLFEWMLARWDVDINRKTPDDKTVVDLAFRSMTEDVGENLTSPILKRFVHAGLGTFVRAIQRQVWEEKEKALMDSTIVGIELPKAITETILQFLREPRIIGDHVEESGDH